MRLIYTSTYTFSGLEGSLILKIIVKDSKGDLVSEDSFKQEDRMDRKYGVTTNKEHKYVQQRSFIEVSLDLWKFLFLGFQIRDRKHLMKVTWSWRRKKMGPRQTQEETLMMSSLSVILKTICSSRSAHRLIRKSWTRARAMLIFKLIRPFLCKNSNSCSLIS